MEESKLILLLMEKITEQAQVLQLSPEKVAGILKEDLEKVEKILNGSDPGLGSDVLYNHCLRLPECLFLSKYQKLLIISS